MFHSRESAPLVAGSIFAKKMSDEVTALIAQLDERNIIVGSCTIGDEAFGNEPVLIAHDVRLVGAEAIEKYLSSNYPQAFNNNN